MTNPGKALGVLAAAVVVTVAVAACSSTSDRPHDSPSLSSPRTPANGGNGHDGQPGVGTPDGNGGNGSVHKDPEPQQKTAAPGIVVSPESVTLGCPSDTCAQPITIRNTGGGAVRIGVISFTDETDSNFSFGRDCMNQHLVPGEECTFRVGWYGPSDDQANVYTANLRITTDHPGVQAYVAVTRLPTGPIVTS